MTNKTITIMADFGMGPYAWMKDASDETSYVGINIANAVDGFDELNVSPKLERDFDVWITLFECHSHEESFDWQYFNSEGMALSHRLYKEFGGMYRVFYDKPCEDPGSDIDERTEID